MSGMIALYAVLRIAEAKATITAISDAVAGQSAEDRELAAQDTITPPAALR